MNKYIGHPQQLRGAESYVLQNGKGNGMRFLWIRNGLGLEAWISLDRCADLARVSLKGDNLAFFSPCGYVGPQYYDPVELGFLKSFTAGFVTTCGLSAVGSPCVDDGEALPLHGVISNTPAELNGIEETDEGLVIRATVRECRIFSRKLVLQRCYRFSYQENKIAICDTILNEGDAASPFMLLYHCNMGYPLLSEKSIVKIPHHQITARNPHSAQSMDTALQMETPQPGYEECCYYYDVISDNGRCTAGIYSPEIEKGVIMSYNKEELPCFTEWKMMGCSDYVLGLEPGNCTPDGRDVLRENGTLQFIAPGERRTASLEFRFAQSENEFEGAF